MGAEGEVVSHDLRWRTWAANPEGITGSELLLFVNNELFPAIKNAVIPERWDSDTLERQRKRLIMIKQSFTDMNNYMVNGICMRELINYIHSNVQYEEIEQRDTFGEMYESFLHDLQGAGDAGEFYTPRAVTDFAIEMLDPQLGDAIFDPAAGTGGFLCAAVRHIRENYIREC